MKLATITAPEMDYGHEEKGDALHAMETALAMERLNLQVLHCCTTPSCGPLHGASLVSEREDTSSAMHSAVCHLVSSHHSRPVLGLLERRSSLIATYAWKSAKTGASRHIRAQFQFSQSSWNSYINSPKIHTDLIGCAVPVQPSRGG